MADKKTIGLANENREIIALFIDKGIFKDQIDVARFAFSIAINDGIENIPLGNYDTTWNVGSFDPDGKLKTLMSLIEPETSEPYRRIEIIANYGLAILKKDYEKNSDIFLEDLLADI